MRNAMVLVMLGQGVPLLLAGDEFGNSQQGNNNCYCQDNKMGWINWRMGKKQQEFGEFTKNMIRFRKNHPILRVDQPMQM